MKCAFEWKASDQDDSDSESSGGVLTRVESTPDIDGPKSKNPESNNPDKDSDSDSDRDGKNGENQDEGAPSITPDNSTPQSETPDGSAIENSTLGNSATEDEKTKTKPESINPFDTSDSAIKRNTDNSSTEDEIREVNTLENSTLEEEAIGQVPAQEPDSIPGMATFEAPYDEPTPSGSSTSASTSASSNPSSSASISTSCRSTKSNASTSSPSLRDKAPTPPDTPSSLSSDLCSEGLLETTPAATQQDLICSLHLIADSIAQQRQLASKSILHNQFYWAILILVFEYLYRVLWITPADWILVLILWICGVIFTLSAIKMWTGGYLDEAERVGRWSWLFGVKWVENFTEQEVLAPLQWALCQGIWFRVPGGHVEKALAWCGAKRGLKKKETKMNNITGTGTGVGVMGQAWEEYSSGTESEIDLRRECSEKGWMQDKVIVSRFNGRVIATLVMRVVEVDIDSVVTVMEDEHGEESCPFPLECGLRTQKMVIRAWTVLQKYRGFGVGVGILQFAIEYARELGLQGPEFAVDHANSLRVLPKLANGGMDRNEKRARDRLAKEIRKCVAAEQALKD
ncbi:hypothetical protein N7520_002291 [Penicillium odoratum]|uniref:uncharacterized protein n=1 Tax=Penicillium odoratum TaxID=1167516 RepID=UPI002549B6D4|nr:uncharacterized protein N7520_002291 [Penicillium odoratum]KAJ5771762.1 hypothetical protein N7520_002291 [Penicillium odoratum]